MKKVIGFFCSALFASIPATSQALELAGEKLELYGKAHVSMDYDDPDAAGEDSQFSVSNNSTRLGFKGKHNINQQTQVLWQYEQEVDIAESGGEFATRNSFLGLKGWMGEVRAGHHDTPSKTLGSRWGMFSDTVGDRRAILGAYNGYGNVLNDRADNSILYIKEIDALELQAMYSASNPSENVSGTVDDNDFDLISLSLTYNTGNFVVAGAFEQWSLDPVNASEEVDNLRLAASYTVANIILGAIFEATESDDDVFDRNAFGFNVAYKISNTTDVRVQTLMAEENDAQDDSGAAQLAIGLFNQLDASMQIYAAFTVTDNDSQAQYQGVDGGHGDELETEPGGDPSAISFGAVYKF